GEGPWLRIIHAGCKSQDWTYRELVIRALRWSATFRQSGLQAGDRVLIVLPHGIDLYASHCGAMLMGARPAIFGRPSAKHSLLEFGRSLRALYGDPGYRTMVVDEPLAVQLATLDSFGDLPPVLSLSALSDDPMATSEVADPEPDSVAILQ